MTSVFVANLGVRDVVVDGSVLREPRREGEALLAAWPKVASKVTLPILGPTLAYLRDVGREPDRVVLVTTDQPETAPSVHRSRDTIHYGEVARQVLGQTLKIGSERIFVRSTRDENPSLYDEMYRFYRRLLGNERDRAFSDATRCYVSPVGGTPAANAGLLHAAVERFGAGCLALYLREGTTRPVELDIGRALHRALLRRAALAQIEAYQFAAALPLLRELGLPEPGLALTEYCQRRLNFDFAGACRALERVWAQARPNERRFLDQAMTEARELDGGADAGLLLVELAENMRVSYQSGAYLDYLTRLVRFEEAAARLVVEKHLPPLNYLENDPGAQEERRQQIAEQPDLLEYLRGIGVGGQPLRYEQSNTVVLLALVDYVVADRPGRPAEWTAEPGRRAELAGAQEILRWMERALNRVRNAGVHRFGGASAESIAELYGGAAGQPRDLTKDVWRVVELVVGPGRREWLVDRAKWWLRGALRE